MADLLSTSLTGLLAFQRGMELTGHNIANANTPGYSRQIGQFTARESVSAGSGIGRGTQLATVKRIYDELLGVQLRSATTGFSRFNTMTALANRLDLLFADPNTGLNTGLQSFFGAVQDLANDPSSISARQALLGEAEGVAERFRGLDQRLAEADQEVSQRIAQSVTEINNLAAGIGDINSKIALSIGRGGQQPNDLLDQRESLVRDLSEQVSVNTALQDDGTLSIFIGSGQTLVIGSSARQLVASSNQFDVGRREVAYQGNNGITPLDIGLTGGALGGLLEFRSQMLDPARQSLGQTALAFAQSFNEQHIAGMDLRGALGTDFFSIDGPAVLTSSDNTGTGTASVTVSDLATVTGDDYILRFDSGSYNLRLASNGQPVAMSGSGTALDPFVAQGLSIQVGGVPVNGDKLLIRSTSDAVTSLKVSISDPQAIAMATPTRTSQSNANLGDANISPTTIVDRNDPALLSTSVIQFTSPNTYDINGAGAFAYTPGNSITINGSEFSIDGSPLAGDQFTIEANFGAAGDNSNGLLLGKVRSLGIIEGGTVNILSNYGRLVASVGSATRQVKINMDAQSIVLNNVEAAQLSNSGVNLDEEAANLIRYQQAYQASAQVIAVASSLFDTVLAAVRR